MKTIVWILGLLAAFSGVACGADLGACPDAATYAGALNEQGVHRGQDLINGACAGGTCHSASANGQFRFGAPATLNFDLSGSDPGVVAAGVDNVRNWASHMWHEVEGGSMPPEGTRPALSEQEKEDMRVFLACGAERLEPMAPDPGDDPFLVAHTTLDATCMGCHDSSISDTAGGGFSMGTRGDVCSMYTAFVNAGPANCDGTRMIVVPNEPTQSLLVAKLDGVNLNACGGLMPAGTPEPFINQQPEAVEALRSWIASGALKPVDCP
ncbi:MAG: hypothetical protein OXR73_25020 [Myxococcales bacterium]|nr:hypothetical protein [Myxococcales bacterium]